MAEKTGISWTDHTFNPWWGCVRVSEACRHCYAETFANRVGQKVWGVQAERRFFGDKHWNEPRKWNAAAEAARQRRRVFCASMADVFEAREDLDVHRTRLWRLIEATPAIDWLLLTKRPENIAMMLPPTWVSAPRLNVWLGTTAEDQESADARTPQLLQVPAVVHFLSVEPMLGPITLRNWLGGTPAISWVITGGESGPGYRQMDQRWVRDLRDECIEAGRAFFHKQGSGLRAGVDPWVEEPDGSRWKWEQFPRTPFAPDGQFTPPERTSYFAVQK